MDIVFLLDGTFAQLISAIDTGWLRLGLHVRSINVVGCNILDRDGQNTCDSSESYVSNVPVPAAVWMLGTGLLGLIGFSRRKL